LRLKYQPERKQQRGIPDQKFPLAGEVGLNLSTAEVSVRFAECTPSHRWKNDPIVTDRAIECAVASRLDDSLRWMR